MKGSFLTISLAFIVVVLIGSTMGVFNSIAQTASSLLAVVTYNSSPVATFTYTITSPQNDVITVSGPKILRNGSLFVVRGMILDSFHHPRSESEPRKLAGQARFWGVPCSQISSNAGDCDYTGKDELTDGMNNWGLNTLRFNVGEPYLAEGMSTYSPQYLQEIGPAIAAARAKGFIVILALFREGTQSLPSQTTLAAVKKLGKLYGSDRGIILELSNEPYSPVARGNGVDGKGWDIWRNGGTYNGTTYIGHQQLINALRSLGAQNAIIVQPIAAIKEAFSDFPFTDATGLQDPRHAIIYAAHPFLATDNNLYMPWSTYWGDFAQTHPFIITAFNANPTDSFCDVNNTAAYKGIDLPIKYLQYLQARNIGLIGFAFDSAYTMVSQDLLTSTKVRDACGKRGGYGEITKNYFTGNPVLLIGAATSTVASGGSTSIVWNTIGATSCRVAGPNVNATGVKGMESTGHLTENATYTLTCQTPQGVKTDTATVTVVDPTKLQFLFCDIKRAVTKAAWHLDENNYKAVVDAFRNKLGCNGIRFPIDFQTAPDDITKIAPDSNAEGYTKLYRDVYSYARKQGFYIYANLFGSESQFNQDTKQHWSSITSTYTNYFCPDFVGPFNESGVDNKLSIVKDVRSKLKSTCTDPFGNVIEKQQIVGPDSGAVSGALSNLQQEENLVTALDIVSAHANKGGSNYELGGDDANDRSASLEDWKKLKQLAGNKPVWVSETGALWSIILHKGVNAGKEIGIKAMIDSHVVNGIVIYMAWEKIVDSNNDGVYKLTPDGEAIVTGLSNAGWKIPPALKQ